ncbi:hypothetical protein [Leptolyngbya phage Lbo-JY46]
MTNKLFYFAYGSNLSIERLVWRISEPFSAEVYTLKDWKLAFNAGYSDAFANITPHEGVSVQGVLYEIDTRQAKKLDLFEALYDRFYFLNGDKICFTYVARETNEYIFPDITYLRIIIEGATKFGLKDTLSITKEKLKQVLALPKRKSKKREKVKSFDFSHLNERFLY